MINAISLTSLRDYEAWQQSGGIARSGIPDVLFMALTMQVHQFRAVGGVFSGQLGAVNDLWSALPTNGAAPSDAQLGDNMIKANLGVLAARLAAANSVAAALQEQAGALRATVQSLYGVINRYVSDDNTAIQSAEIQRQSQEVIRQVQTTVYNNARHQLEGDQGFLNGFLTGLTVGAYNPVKENMDAARNALQAINTSINAINASVATIRARQAELQSSAQAVSRIEGVDLSVLQCQNTLVGAQNDLASALTKIENADAAIRATVVRIYFNQAKTFMASLREWQTAFAGLN